MTDLTERQAQLHNYLCERWANPPTLQEMADHMEVKNRNGVVCHLTALAAKGYIEKFDDKRSRGVRLLKGPNLDGSVVEIAGRSYQLVSTEEITF
jgi:SOS-response transcriptional repressor LexA